MRSDPRLREYDEQLYAERDRLGRGEGRLELVRTQELLGRFLPPPPAKIIDLIYFPLDDRERPRGL